MNGPSDQIIEPSIGEIYEIANRRRRNRQRLAYSAVATLTAAGAGFGVLALSSLDQSIAPATSSAVQLPATGPESSGSDGNDAGVAEAEPSQTPGTDRAGCGHRPDDWPNWLVVGQSGFLNRPTTSFDEIDQLAAVWQIPNYEVKALAWWADEVGSSLDKDDIDVALGRWFDDGYEAEQLTAVAEDWNVSKISVKVLHLIGRSEPSQRATDCDR